MGHGGNLRGEATRSYFAETLEKRARGTMPGGVALFMRFVFLGLALVLFFTWIGAFVVFHVAAALIHLLLILAIVFLVIHLFSGRRPA
jgi:hypothetical protein